MIAILKSIGDTRCATCALPVSNLQQKLITYPKDVFYSCKKIAWMVEHLMKAWVEHILELYVFSK